MGKAFVDPNELVPVWEFPPEDAVFDEEGNRIQPNVIYIKAKMDLATKNKVTGAMVRFSGRGGRDAEIELDLASNLNATLRHNIVRWEGPEFRDAQGRPIPVNEETIGHLNPDWDLVQAVIDEIARRNPVKQSPNPKSTTRNGSTNAGGLVLLDASEAARTWETTIS